MEHNKFRLGLRLDPNDFSYKKPFYTAGELLDTYLLKEEKPMYFGRYEFSFMALERSLMPGLKNLISAFSNNYYSVDVFRHVNSYKVRRLYGFNRLYFGGYNFENLFPTFDYSFFNKFFSRIAPKEHYNIVTYDELLSFGSSRIRLIYPYYIHYDFGSKLERLYERSKGVFIPYNAGTVVGGTSYAMLVIAQRAEILLDFFLSPLVPTDAFIEDITFPIVKFHELGFKYHLLGNYGPKVYSNYDLNPVSLSNILLNSYTDLKVKYFGNSSGEFRITEQSLFHSFELKKNSAYELETLEYYDTITFPFETFINAGVNIFVDKIGFLDTLYNAVLQRQVDRVGANYVIYIEMHQAEEVILDHKDIPAFQLALLWFGNVTHLAVFHLNRIRALNLKYRTYLSVYENFRFSQELHYMHLIDYVDEISEETAKGYYDIARFLEEFYDDDEDMIEEDFPSTYHGDLEDDDYVIGEIYPYAYHKIFFDQYEYSAYYYHTDEFARNYNTMALYKPYNMSANGYKGLVYEGESHMTWFTTFLLSTLKSDYDLPFYNFVDDESKRTGKIRSFFHRTEHIPTSNVLEDFLDERSVDLSYMSVRQFEPINSLTTYSIDSASEVFSDPAKYVVTPQRYDSGFPMFRGVKFRRV